MPGLEKRPGRSVAAGPKGRRNAPSGRSADSETSARPPRSARQTRAEASDRCGGGSAREAGRNTDPVKCDGQPRFGPGTAKGQATVTSRRDASRAALRNNENQKIAIGKHRKIWTKHKRAAQAPPGGRKVGRVTSEPETIAQPATPPGALERRGSDQEAARAGDGGRHATAQRISGVSICDWSVARTRRHPSPPRGPMRAAGKQPLAGKCYVLLKERNYPFRDKNLRRC